MSTSLVEISLGPDKLRVYRVRSFRRKKKEQVWFNLTQLIGLLNRRQPEGSRKLRSTTFTLRKRWRPNRDYKSQSELFGLDVNTDRTRKPEKKKPQDTWARWPLTWSAFAHPAYSEVASALVCEMLLAKEQLQLDMETAFKRPRSRSLNTSSASSRSRSSKRDREKKGSKSRKRSRQEANKIDTTAPTPASLSTAAPTGSDDLMWYAPPFEQPHTTQPERLLSRLNVNNWSIPKAPRS